jgi:hypothetical protein
VSSVMNFFSLGADDEMIADINVTSFQYFKALKQYICFISTKLKNTETIVGPF